MPRPLTKPRKLLLAMSEEDHGRAVALAAGRPLGPAILAAALGTAPARSVEPEPRTPAEALDAWTRRWLPAARKAAAMPQAVTDALRALEKAIR